MRKAWWAPVAPDATVWLVRLRQDGDADLDPGSFAELPGHLGDPSTANPPYLSVSPYWLTIRDGAVIDICEQHQP